MPCQTCQTHWFWKKIGRCQRCLDQLTVLSVVSWMIWWVAFKESPESIPSVALLFAGFAFNLLLAMHLWMKFVVFPLQERAKKSR